MYILTFPCMALNLYNIQLPIYLMIQNYTEYYISTYVPIHVQYMHKPPEMNMETLQSN